MEKNSKIYVAGHRGLVGSAIVRKLEELGYHNLVCMSRKQLDLRNQYDVDRFFDIERPEYVFMAAAKVGGINYNKTYPAEFITENLQIQTNLIKSSFDYRVKKICQLGTACIYPKMAPQPIKEEYLMTGPLEETNEAYALAKISGLMMTKKYYQQYGLKSINVMPTNLYGINDRFDVNHGHVIPGLINKFLEAKETNAESIECWGTGTPTREFLFSDDLADALIYLMNNHDYIELINVGIDNEITIRELAEKIRVLVGYGGQIVWNSDKPDGTPRRKMCNDKLKSLGWSPKYSLDDGLKLTLDWYLKNKGEIQ